jgi:hypothetical protein
MIRPFDYVTNSAREKVNEEKSLSHDLGQDVVMLGLSQNSQSSFRSGRSRSDGIQVEDLDLSANMIAP